MSRTLDDVRRRLRDLDVLTDEARAWIERWLTDAMAAGVPAPYIYGLPVDGNSYGPTVFSRDAVHLEWDWKGPPWRSVALDCGPGEGRYVWLCDDMEDGDCHDAEVTLDEATTERVVTVLRWLADPLGQWWQGDGMSDEIDDPPHYAPIAGVRPRDICDHLDFNLGNALKYLWRAGKKGDRAKDWRKAAWYLHRESAWLRDRCVSVSMAPGLRTLANRVLQSGAADVTGAFRDMLRAIALHEELWHDDLAGLAAACELEAAS